MTPLAIALGIAGLTWGVIADRVSARWPEHLPEGPEGQAPDEGDAAALTPNASSPEAGLATDGAVPEGSDRGAGPTAGASSAQGRPTADDEPSPIRGVDWRTGVVAIISAAALFLVAGRFEGPQLVLFSAWVVVLVLMLATDLDQRLLPDILTLPLVPIAAVVGLSRLNPFVVDGDLLLPLMAAVVFPAAFLLLSIPFGPGAIGIGDLKLLVSVGLMLGFGRTFTAIVLGALLSGVVVAVLLAARRIGRRSYIPYGPFLIIGTLWAALIAA